MTATVATPAGNLRIAVEEGKLTCCRWCDSPASGEDCDGLLPYITQLHEYFAGERRAFDLAIEPHGTPFEQRVWHELQKIPYGETRTYSEIAAAVGCPAGQRAVARACSRNHICIIIPCHRVVARHGLGGYTAPHGVVTKHMLLALERSNIERI